MTSETSPSPSEPGEVDVPLTRTGSGRSTGVFVAVSVLFSVSGYATLRVEEPFIMAFGAAVTGGLLLFWVLSAVRRRLRRSGNQQAAEVAPRKGFLAQVIGEVAAAERGRKKEQQERVRTRIHTPTEAERFVAGWLRDRGFRGARTTPPSGDAGIDVSASGVSVQVKRYSTNAVGRPELQQLVGAAPVGDTAVFFTSSRYTAAAAEYANQRDVALFTFDSEAGYPVRAVNRAAERLLRNRRARK
ncbi:restriction endonuclease [Nocardiopsis halotolerans]|uniref:restriction endonuclease n=1 Tax=Nocardiopsis halotolerans TaxID=124252 RepID=UPI000347D5F7|nr:restriction endonuclease [Nocardiopsis halotolerans]